MAQQTVGVRELKARLSSYLQEVKAGGEVVLQIFTAKARRAQSFLLWPLLPANDRW